jgi:hypothetical protein
MPRQITIPSQTVQEDIIVLEESPGNYIRVVVGVLKTGSTAFNTDIPTKEYRITGADLTELIGGPTNWATDKPSGTYRNEDLWHYIDLQRNANA